MAEVLRRQEAQLEEDLENQDELNDFETQRDSYGGILREKWTDLPHGLTLSTDSKKLISDAQKLVESEII